MRNFIVIGNILHAWTSPTGLETYLRKEAQHKRTRLSPNPCKKTMNLKQHNI